METLGVREGAVESPHAFNAYIDGLRTQLETQHPQLCRLMGITIAILLYADDAALPADSEEDLQRAAAIFEDFCNLHRLFVSTPKSFVTVFHNASDTGVQYDSDKVYVDGRLVDIQIYGPTMAAAQEFKYLGVIMDSTCSSAGHFASRMSALDRSAHLLSAGLSKLPSYPHSLLSYLWSSLAAPVGNYGMDLFAHSQAEVQAFENKERKWWRRLLQVGGRSPNAAVSIVMGLPPCVIVWKVQRAALFLKLANAPVDSWRHLAFIAHHHMQSDWFKAAFADVLIILPRVRLIPTMVSTAPYLSSSGTWSDEGEWLSLHAYRLPVNLSGRRYCPVHDDTMSKSVRCHVSRITQQLRTRLTRQHWTQHYDTVIETASASASSKVSLLASRLQQPGPPVHTSLDTITVPSHRAAMASFLCADWFFPKQISSEGFWRFW